MSTDANERASIGGVKAAACGLGTLCAGYLGLGLIDWIGGADEQAGFVYFGVILGALTIVSVLVSGLITRERVGGTALDTHSASLLNAARSALRNRACLAVLVATILSFIRYAFHHGGAAHFLTYH